MVVVVVAVSKASSGRAWQSSSSYLYIYSILLKRIRYRVFFGVFLVNFWRDFFSFFYTFFVKNTTRSRQTDTHYIESLPKFMCVSVRVCGVIVV